MPSLGLQQFTLCKRDRAAFGSGPAVDRSAALIYCAFDMRYFTVTLSVTPRCVE